MSLRQLLWRYEATTYQGLMYASHIVAGVFNSQRTKRSDKVWSWVDVHPQHQAHGTKGATGVQVISTCWGWGGAMQWAEGFDPMQMFG